MDASIKSVLRHGLATWLLVQLAVAGATGTSSRLSSETGRPLHDGFDRVSSNHQLEPTVQLAQAASRRVGSEEDERKAKVEQARRAAGQWSPPHLDALRELANFYDSNDQYELEVVVRRQIVERVPAGSQELVDLLSLANVLSSLRKYDEESAALQRALRNKSDELVAYRPRIVSELANSLLNQKKYKEAEPFLRESKSREGLATALEGQDKLREAEAIWRSMNATPETLGRLEKNLIRQGRDKDALETAELGHRQRQAETKSREEFNPARVAELRHVIELMEKAGASNRDGGAGVAMLRNQLELELAKQDPSPEGRAAKRDEANKKLLVVIQPKLAETEVGRRHMELVNKFGGLDQKTPDWALKPDLSMASASASLGLRMLEQSRMVDGLRMLEGACPALIVRASIDLPRGGDVRFEPTISAQRCFSGYVLGLAGSTGKSNGQVDEALFVAAQQATQSDAGAALTSSAARRYVAAKGGGAILEGIDAAFAAMKPISEPVVVKSVARFQEMQARDIPMPDRQNQMLEIMTEMAQMAQRTRPHVERVTQFQAELKQRMPEYAGLRNPEPVALQEIVGKSGSGSALLHPDEALLIWLPGVGAANGIVLAATATQAAWARIPMTGDEVTARVTRLRKQIDPCTFDAASKECRDAELTFDRNAAHELYKALVGLPEILAVLNPKVIKHLMVVPSGSLTSLPPSVLIASKPDPSQQLDRSPDGWIDADWLLNRYSTSVLPAVSSLKALRAPTASGTVERDRSSPMKQLLSRVLKAAQSDSAAGSQTRAKREGRLFMLADPDFSGTGKPVKPCERIEVASARSVSSYFRDGAANRSVLAALPPLPCTRQEGEQLEGLLGGKVLYGSDARKSQLYSAENTKLLAEAEVIAFATHGLVSGSHGSGEPALALSAPLPSESDDAALLRASEIAALRLKADLVLLSACNTASPESDDASGLSGLAKAFFHAGAKAALVAHWRINDAATAAIVTEFMRLRAAGTNKADALRKASQQMLESAIAPSSLASKRVTSHPRYWAPFTLMGEPR